MATVYELWFTLRTEGLQLEWTSTTICTGSFGLIPFRIRYFLTNYICYCYRTEVGLNLIVVIILRNICNPNTIIMRWLLAPAWLSHNEGRGR